jgi:hypothetical protein
MEGALGADGPEAAAEEARGEAFAAVAFSYSRTAHLEVIPAE